MTKGAIIYFFDGRSTARHKKEVLQLVAGEMKKIFEGIALLINSGSLTQKRRVKVYQILTGALPSRKCSIKESSKCKNFLYVFTEKNHFPDHYFKR